MTIRILLLLSLAAIGYQVFLKRNRLQLHIPIVILLLGLGGVFVVFPDLTTRIANFVGVGRGVDLINYLIEVGLLFVTIHYYSKFVHLQTQITTLTRAMALLRADLDRLTQREP
jgi:hypothetical protein